MTPYGVILLHYRGLWISSKEDAEKVAEVLLWADMSGIKPMGIAKMTGTEPLQNVKQQHAPKIDRDTKLSQLINAGANPAQLVSQLATDVAISKAQEHGFGIVGMHNYFSSNGTQAFYVQKMAEQNLIGIACTSQPASVAAFGGIDPIFGTNPIGFSFPTLGEPLVFDMATSAMTWHGLVLAKARGEKIPENMAIDKDGQPTLDPAAAMDGALLPFGGYKGAGLSMIIEALAGPLVGAAYGQLNGEWGALFMAIDPELLVDTQQFKTNCSDLITKIKSARKGPGADNIRLPGERAAEARKAAEKSGMVEVDDAILKELGYI